MTDQISTLHLKQRVTFTFVCSVFLFHLSAPIEIPRTKVLLYVNYVNVIWSAIQPKIIDKQLHGAKTVKILLRVPELVDSFAD